MDIIDFHAHIYPEKIAAKAIQSVSDFYDIKMDCQGTAEKLIEEGKKCNLCGYVVHSVAVTPAHVVNINDYILSECEKHSEFYGFGTMHADFENKIGEAERMFNLGLKGVKIHPDTQMFNMDDERMFELYDYLQQNKKQLLVHCGDYRYDYSHPKRLKNILRNFPDLIAVGAHFGGWSIHDVACEYLADEKCYLDTSSSFFMMGVKRAKELIKMYGAERILFGTDFPMWTASKELEQFFSMELTDEENELILNKNAKKILNIKEV